MAHEDNVQSMVTTPLFRGFWLICRILYYLEIWRLQSNVLRCTYRLVNRVLMKVYEKRIVADVNQQVRQEPQRGPGKHSRGALIENFFAIFLNGALWYTLYFSATVGPKRRGAWGNLPPPLHRLLDGFVNQPDGVYIMNPNPCPEQGFVLRIGPLHLLINKGLRVRFRDNVIQSILKFI